MAPRAELAHHSRNRVRLRIAHRRRDTRYFMRLYEELRAIDDISDIQINPITGSVLLRYPDGAQRRVLGSLVQLGLLSTEPLKPDQSGILRRIEGFLGDAEGSAAKLRTVLFLLMAAVTIHQVRQGKLLIPIITLLVYGYQILASHKAQPTPE